MLPNKEGSGRKMEREGEQGNEFADRSYCSQLKTVKITVVLLYLS